VVRHPDRNWGDGAGGQPAAQAARRSRRAQSGSPPVGRGRDGANWLNHIELGGVASFALLLATPHRVTTWDFDGQQLVTTEHPEGTHMLTSGGPEDRKADGYLRALEESSFPHGWRRLVGNQPPKDDPAALVVRHERDGWVFATVFGELIEAQPGRLRLEYSRQPWTTEPWPLLEVSETG
jgi:hypothetical protein